MNRMIVRTASLACLLAAAACDNTYTGAHRYSDDASTGSHLSGADTGVNPNGSTADPSIRNNGAGAGSYGGGH